MNPTTSSAEHRWRRSAARFLRHVVRLDALRAFAVAVAAFAVVATLGADTPVGQAGLVVIGTLVTYILLPDQPHRFWRVRATDLAETVPPSDLLAAGRETVKALALQTGGAVEPYAGALWEDAVQGVAATVADPRRVVVDMDYRITVNQGPAGQLVRANSTSLRCWPNASEVIFSFCSDVDALWAEFGAEGSFSREIVTLDPAEDLDAWELRAGTYPVTFVVDGKKVQPARRETRRLGAASRAHRIVFDVSETAMTRRFTPVQVTSEFHQASHDRSFSVKFSTYCCVGATQISFEVDDPTAQIYANDFMLDPSLSTQFFHRYGLASHCVTLQTGGDAVLYPPSGVTFSWAPGQLLAPIPELLDGILPEGTPLPRRVTLPETLVRTEARTEPLVPITGIRCIDAYYHLGIVDAVRVLRARESVARRLLRAKSNLESKVPGSFELVVLDGWRDEHLQAKLVSHYREVHGGTVEGYVADPGSTIMRPPHVVGAAVDVTLSFNRQLLALGSAYDDFSETAHLSWYEQSDSTVRRLRRLLAEVMLSAGFAPYPLEWWHWSYGDDVWATFIGTDALYDIVEDERS